MMHIGANDLILSRASAFPKACIFQAGTKAVYIGRASAGTRQCATKSDMSWLWTFGSVPELPAAELNQLVGSPRANGSPINIIDVRTEAEWRGGHIKGARNASFLPPWSFGSRIDPLIKDLPKDAEIYVICLSAHRSIGALKWLRQQGISATNPACSCLQLQLRCVLISGPQVTPT